ncbi:MAG: hypothetical protein M3297_15470 [Thermoproteota archaeon]|nr:hypothetical protein [Thermoproteota archaeon]
MSTNSGPFDAMIKIFEDKEIYLDQNEPRTSEIIRISRISEYKQLAKDILKNHTLTIYSILSFLQMSVIGEIARQSQITLLKDIVVQLEEVKNNPEMLRYINKEFDKYNKYLERYSYLSEFRV